MLNPPAINLILLWVSARFCSKTEISIAYCITSFNLVCIFTSNFDERAGIVAILYRYKNTYLSHLINYSSQSLHNITGIVYTNISTHTHFTLTKYKFIDIVPLH